MFDSLTKAFAYIKQNWNKFWNMKQELNARLTTIDQAMTKAQASNDQASLGRLIVAKSQTLALLREYQDLTNKVNPLKSFLASSNELGVLPIWLAAGAATIATTLYLFFQKVQNEGKALELIQQGILAPSEAKAIFSGGGITDTLGGVNKIIMWGALAYALFLFGPQISKRLT